MVMGTSCSLQCLKWDSAQQLLLHHSSLVTQGGILFPTVLLQCAQKVSSFIVLNSYRDGFIVMMVEVVFFLFNYYFFLYASMILR